MATGDAAAAVFPESFRDFFSRISELENDDDAGAGTMLENKFIPRQNSGERPMYSRCFGGDSDSGSGDSCQRTPQHGRRNRRSFHRLPATPTPKDTPTAPAAMSPAVGRRRASSIAVARPPPDLTRFLLAETPRPPPTSTSPSPSTSRPVSPRPSNPPPVEVRTYRARTASMPAVPRHKPMLGQLRRPDDEVQYYRVRSFSITPNGIFNLGDSFRSRRSHSINSVSSTGSSHSEDSPDRLIAANPQTSPTAVPRFKVAMLGASGVGKTALTCQFTTSEYICAYDTSLDEEFGQKTVSVMLDGREAELEIVDHPASEMSVESYCTTYNPDVFVVVYSVVDRKSLKVAEDILLFLWKSDYVASRGVILVGNKADLERRREVPITVGRKVANSCGCKFIETSSGLDHNVDELLVGILAQVQLNPRRDRHKLRKDKKHRASGRRLLRHLLGIKRQAKSCENLLVL